MPASDVLSPAEVAEFRALTVDLAMPDSCEIRRETSGGVDEFGNDLPPTVTTVETSACVVLADGLSPREEVIASRLGWTVPMKIDLPFATVATPPDTIRVNGTRVFEIGGVVKEGVWGIVATAVVEERG